mgnify:FL=1|jgi:hypothetical protein
MARRTGKVFKTWEEAVAYRDKHGLEIIIEQWWVRSRWPTYLVPWQPKPKKEDCE